MNEETTDEYVEPNSGRRVKPMYVAFAVIGLVLAGALLIWLFSGGRQGNPVPAPRTVTFDEPGGQPTGTGGNETVAIEPGQAERLGITLETVGETLADEVAGVAATGVIQANAYGQTPVVPLVGGIVRRVGAELGENVRSGQTVAVLYSDEAASAQARYLTLQTEEQTARQNYQRSARLASLNPVSRRDLDESAAKLKTAEAQLVEFRRLYNRTAKLLEIGAVSREEFEQATTKLRTAEAETEQFRNLYTRAVAVAEINPVSRSEFEQAAVKLRTAETERAAARQRLLLIGLPASRIDSLRSPSQITSEINLTAPVSGTVTTRSVNVGSVVEANKELMTVTNLSTVWAVAQVYENDLARMRVGSGASVTSGAYPNRLFRGRVTYIDPNINVETRTAQVRVELDNPGQILRIGMYVSVAFGSVGNAETTMPVVPASAVQIINDRQAVFAATDRPDVFALRFVRLGPETAGRYAVLEGLNVGDRVVTNGAFSLRAEWLKSRPAS